MTQSTVLALLPHGIRAQSISDREVVLPLDAALAAIDIIEARGLHILGWEGWLKYPDGRHGHGGPMGSASLENLSPADAAELCRRTIAEEAARWREENPRRAEQMYFCITTRTGVS